MVNSGLMSFCVNTNQSRRSLGLIFSARQRNHVMKSARKIQLGKKRRQMTGLSLHPPNGCCCCFTTSTIDAPETTTPIWQLLRPAPRRIGKYRKKTFFLYVNSVVYIGGKKGLFTMMCSVRDSASHLFYIWMPSIQHLSLSLSRPQSSITKESLRFKLLWCCRGRKKPTNKTNNFSSVM